jgi:hypothetical protein
MYNWQQQNPPKCTIGNNKILLHVQLATTKSSFIYNWQQQNPPTCTIGNNKSHAAREIQMKKGKIPT